jgi:hypothetical protein
MTDERLLIIIMNWVNVEESRIGRPRRIWHEGVQTAMGI